MISDNELLEYAQNFLYYGFNPVPKSDPFSYLSPELWDYPKTYQEFNSLHQTERQGFRIFQNIIQELLRLSDQKTIILPLSGGMDSRFVLGFLLNFLSAREIQTITYGVPGTWDFEIPKHIVKLTGVRQELINLNSIVGDEYTRYDLIAKPEYDMLPIFEVAVHKYIQQYFGDAGNYWSGFLGETICGHHKNTNRMNELDSIISFTEKNRGCRNVNLTSQDYDPATPIRSFQFRRNSIMDLDLQLNIGIRQNNYIKPVVVGNHKNTKIPFTHPDWINFCLNAPEKFTQNKTLYKSIATNYFPELFKIPIKNNFGLPLRAPTWQRAIPLSKLALQKWFYGKIWGIRPFLNYFDYDQALRLNTNLKDLAYNNLEALIRRQIISWLDIKQMWRRHQNNQQQLGRALILLTSLELNLRSLQYSIRTSE